MKKLIIIAILGLVFSACNHQGNETAVSEDSALEYYGEKINNEEAVSSEDFFDTFKEGDSIQMILNGKIIEVCKKKGCWMSMSIGTDEEIMVRFKDYGFFVPLNADGRRATIEGWAYKEVMSIEELKHYAFDAGDSEEAIAAITASEISYTFMANGVIIE